MQKANNITDDKKSKIRRLNVNELHNVSGGATSSSGSVPCSSALPSVGSSGVLCW